jgi:hypothetical protein
MNIRLYNPNVDVVLKSEVAAAHFSYAVLPTKHIKIPLLRRPPNYLLKLCN